MMTLVKDIISALGPFKTATEFLCKRNSNFAQAEVILKFVDKLEELGLPLWSVFFYDIHIGRTHSLFLLSSSTRTPKVGC